MIESGTCALCVPLSPIATHISQGHSPLTMYTAITCGLCDPALSAPCHLGGHPLEEQSTQPWSACVSLRGSLGCVRAFGRQPGTNLSARRVVCFRRAGPESKSACKGNRPTGQRGEKTP